MMNFRQILWLLLLQLIVLSGCARYVTNESAPNSYYLNPSKDLKRVGRVALVELKNNSSVHQISPKMTDSLFQEIQKRQIFGLTRIWQDDPAWRGLQLESGMNYTYEELAQMRKALKSDAVLTGTITSFEPHPHMAVGLRLQLIDLTDGQLVWAMEQVWDTTDKTIQKRIEYYYNPRQLIFYDENLSGQLGSVSSLKFFKFVSYEITETLQVDL
jgi:hypothetical protein